MEANEEPWMASSPCYSCCDQFGCRSGQDRLWRMPWAAGPVSYEAVPTRTFSSSRAVLTTPAAPSGGCAPAALLVGGQVSRAAVTSALWGVVLSLWQDDLPQRQNHPIRTRNGIT